MADPTDFTSWYRQLGAAIPWLYGNTNGANEGKSLGALLDNQRILLRDGVKSRFPSYAPADALPHIGGDRQLIQGPNETNDSFITRCKDPWGQWERAGTWVGVLEQLSYYGLFPAVIVQQNGLIGGLTAAPSPGSDPTSLYSTVNANALSSALTSTVAPYRTIPAGTPWFAFDGNTDLTNRFAIILTSWPFAAVTYAYFNDSDSASVTWPVSLPSSTYSVIFSSSTDEVEIYNDGSPGVQTATGTTVRATAKWTGKVQVVAFASGVNPFNTFSSANLGQVKRIISTFRPNALCMGVFYIQSGRMWDYPVGVTWDGYGGQWDSPSSIVQVIGAF